MNRKVIVLSSDEEGDSASAKDDTPKEESPEEAWTNEPTTAFSPQIIGVSTLAFGNPFAIPAPLVTENVKSNTHKGSISPDVIELDSPTLPQSDAINSSVPLIDTGHEFAKAVSAKNDSAAPHSTSKMDVVFGNADSGALFEKFLNVCIGLETVPADKIKLKDKMGRALARADSKYKKSESFTQLLTSQLSILESDDKRLYYCVKEVLDQLKLNKVGRRVALTTVPSTNKNENNILLVSDKEEQIEEDSQQQLGVSSKNSRDVIKLSRTLEKLSRKIKKLGEAEVDLDDDYDSNYLRMRRYEDRFAKVNRKLRELTGESMHMGFFTKRKIRFHGTSNAAVNSLLEQWLNKRKIFPDFTDVHRLLKENASALNLNLTPERLRDMAAEAFRAVGNELQKRRKLDSWDTLQAYAEGYSDPAENDSHLELVLRENRKRFLQQTDELCNKFCQRQLDEKLEPVEVPDNASSSEGEEEEEEEGNDGVESDAEAEIPSSSNDVDNSTSRKESKNGYKNCKSKWVRDRNKEANGDLLESERLLQAGGLEKAEDAETQSSPSDYEEVVTPNGSSEVILDEDSSKQKTSESSVEIALRLQMQKPRSVDYKSPTLATKKVAQNSNCTQFQRPPSLQRNIQPSISSATTKGFMEGTHRNRKVSENEPAVLLSASKQKVFLLKKKIRRSVSSEGAEAISDGASPERRIIKRRVMKVSPNTKQVFPPKKKVSKVSSETSDSVVILDNTSVDPIETHNKFSKIPKCDEPSPSLTKKTSDNADGELVIIGDNEYDSLLSKKSHGNSVDSIETQRKFPVLKIPKCDEPSRSLTIKTSDNADGELIIIGDNEYDTLISKKRNGTNEREAATANITNLPGKEKKNCNYSGIGNRKEDIRINPYQLHSGDGKRKLKKSSENANCARKRTSLAPATITKAHSQASSSPLMETSSPSPICLVTQPRSLRRPSIGQDDGVSIVSPKRRKALFGNENTCPVTDDTECEVLDEKPPIVYINCFTLHPTLRSKSVFKDIKNTGTVFPKWPTKEFLLAETGRILKKKNAGSHVHGDGDIRLNSLPKNQWISLEKQALPVKTHGTGVSNGETTENLPDHHEGGKKEQQNCPESGKETGSGSGSASGGQDPNENENGDKEELCDDVDDDSEADYAEATDDEDEYVENMEVHASGASAVEDLMEAIAGGSNMEFAYGEAIDQETFDNEIFNQDGSEVSGSVGDERENEEQQNELESVGEVGEHGEQQNEVRSVGDEVEIEEPQNESLSVTDERENEEQQNELVSVEEVGEHSGQQNELRSVGDEVEIEEPQNESLLVTGERENEEQQDELGSVGDEGENVEKQNKYGSVGDEVENEEQQNELRSVRVEREDEELQKESGPAGDERQSEEQLSEFGLDLMETSEIDGNENQEAFKSLENGPGHIVSSEFSDSTDISQQTVVGVATVRLEEGLPEGINSVGVESLCGGEVDGSSDNKRENPTSEHVVPEGKNECTDEGENLSGRHDEEVVVESSNLTQVLGKDKIDVEGNIELSSVGVHCSEAEDCSEMGKELTCKALNGEETAEPMDSDDAKLVGGHSGVGTRQVVNGEGVEDLHDEPAVQLNGGECPKDTSESVNKEDKHTDADTNTSPMEITVSRLAECDDNGSHEDLASQKQEETAASRSVNDRLDGETVIKNLADEMLGGEKGDSKANGEEVACRQEPISLQENGEQKGSEAASDINNESSNKITENETKRQSDVNDSDILQDFSGENIIIADVREVEKSEFEKSNFEESVINVDCTVPSKDDDVCFGDLIDSTGNECAEDEIEIISEVLTQRRASQGQSSQDLTPDERVKRFLQNIPGSIEITVKRKRAVSDEAKQALERLKKLKGVVATRVQPEEPDIMVLPSVPTARATPRQPPRTNSLPQRRPLSRPQPQNTQTRQLQPNTLSRQLRPSTPSRQLRPSTPSRQLRPNNPSRQLRPNTPALRGPRLNGLPVPSRGNARLLPRTNSASVLRPTSFQSPRPRGNMFPSLPLPNGFPGASNVRRFGSPMILSVRGNVQGQARGRASRGRAVLRGKTSSARGRSTSVQCVVLD